ncbi:MAG: metalloregulator ArsR/SmtB family transcription factor [Rhodoglobus sp.]|nr:metalloregulator ArsR/SmtB family transcription factor [Rhodoglobus sp.]
MADREFKQALYREFARIGSALASDRRLEILDVLAQAPRHVEALAAEVDMSVANTSQHLQVLKEARLVTSERDGNRVLYRLADEAVLRLWLDLRDVASHQLAEVTMLARSRELGPEGEEVVPAGELAQLRVPAEVLVIDVRPRVEYDHGHIDGALSIPLDELPERIGELPRDRRIVAYCRGAYCTFAAEAVAILRAQGFDAVRTDDGWAEWRAAGAGTRTREPV